MNDDSSKDVIIFKEALRLPAAERADFIERAAAGDADLCHRVKVLLRSHEKAGDFLLEPAPGLRRGVGRATVTGEQAGDRIGRYKLLQQIGEGGCGVVFLADQQEPVRRKVAVKVIKLGMATKN